MADRSDTSTKHAWLADLVARHGRELRGYLARFAQGSADIDDWLQESLLRLCAASLDREVAEPRAYLFRIARNVALGRIEHRKVRDAARLDLEMTARARSESPPMHQVAQTGRDVQQLHDAIERLPERCREVFVLCKIHGFAHREIADILGISVSTVEKHLAKGLKLCRALLLEGGEQPSEDADGETVPEGRRTRTTGKVSA